MLEILAIFEWQYQHRIFLGGGGIFTQLVLL